MKDLSTLSVRIKKALIVTNTTQAKLSRQISVKPQVINFLCENDVKNSRFTYDISTALGLNPIWLATGEGVMFLSEDPRHQIFETYKITPLLSADQYIEALKKDVSPSNVSANCEFAAINSKHENLFAYKSKDPSMLPTISTNSIVFFSWKPEKSIIKSNDIVLVYLSEYKSLVIRRYTTKKTKSYLQPDNPELYNSIVFSVKHTIIGKVIGFTTIINEME